MSDLGPRLAPGRAAFNRGAYFEAHELWEEIWRDLEGADRRFVQGLIQIAAGLHHLAQRRPRPAAALLRKGQDKIAGDVPAGLADLRLATLAAALDEVLVQLARPGVPGLGIPLAISL
jgi:predicted metal-dependent hydrolase